VASHVNINDIPGGVRNLGAKPGTCDKVSPSLMWVNIIK
jgi:hypothetical protein